MVDVRPDQLEQTVNIFINDIVNRTDKPGPSALRIIEAINRLKSGEVITTRVLANISRTQPSYLCSYLLNQIPQELSHKVGKHRYYGKAATITQLKKELLKNAKR